MVDKTFSFKLRHRPLQNLLSAVWSLCILFFTLLMLRITLPYVGGRLDVDFLLTKQEFIHLSHFRYAFYLHIFSSLFVITAGFTQFSSGILRRRVKLHRAIGKAYVFILLCISAPSALCLAFYALGGILSQMSFILLSVLWWWFTFRAYQTIRQGRIEAHRRFMIRSYALTLSAISLRAYQFLLPATFALSAEEIYLIIGWGSWLGNLLVAEWWIRRKME